ncbi:uncharacterized protein hng2 [Eurosta solidaginis]|uniref:uncharacterized protein hng2 n=1 Tax=Eurosta solidaginis TaxID=178769 RepID=UPI003530FABF
MAFKYDIVTLIELIESKPCIWDKTNEYNKNKNQREKNWQEVFSFLEDGYEQLSLAEKKKTGYIIMAKWSNIRDSFLRSLRTKRCPGAKKRYIYSEHLQFLLKLGQKDDTETNFSQVGTKDDSIDVEDLMNSQPPTTSRSEPKSTTQSLSTPLSNRLTSRENRTRSNIQWNDVDREILSGLKKAKHSDESCSSHSRSDHEMLLLSFVPYIRDMNETELMDFQMETITTIKKIKRERVSVQNSSPALTHSDSYQSSLQSSAYQLPVCKQELIVADDDILFLDDSIQM